VANKADLQDIRSIVVEHVLSDEVEVPRGFGIELKANEAKSFALNEASVWVRFEGLRWILLDLVVGRSVTRVHELNRLVD